MQRKQQYMYRHHLSQGNTVSLALLSSASLVCLIQSHTNCPHSTSHGESYRETLTINKDYFKKTSANQQLGCIMLVLCVCNKSYAQSWSAITRLQQTIKSIKHFYFQISTSYFTCLSCTDHSSFEHKVVKTSKSSVNQ